MTNKEIEFLKSFKAGEYAELTILVDIANLNTLVEGLKSLGIKLAVLPKVQAELAFHSDDGKLVS